VTVDRSLKIRLNRQLYEILRTYILEGRIGAGTSLPATRTLAQQLGVGRNTVVAAYDQLLAEGYVEAQSGSGTRVASLLRLEPIEVYEVATFYSMYNLKPVGRYMFEVCQTGPCMLNGSDQIIEHIRSRLNIGIGETTADGLFGLKVVATKFDSDDSPDKILSFYQKSLGKFGNVIQCSGGMDVNFHRHDKDDPVTCEGSGSEFQKALKAGTQNNQHIVAVRSSGSGSTFAVVYVRAWDGKDTI